MKLNHYIYSLVASVLLIFSACTPEEFELGDKTFTSEELVEGIAFTVTHDADNPNIVYLKSLLDPAYQPLWEHPLGRSQEAEVTLQMPFEGTYEVTFGVQTRGGVVYGVPTTFTIDEFCADFVSGEMWENLAGGTGNSKTWVYDDGQYGFMGGPLSYGDPNATENANWGWNVFLENWTPSGYSSESPCGEADYASYMTFDLVGNANYTFYNSATGTTQTGLYSLNTSDHTITFTDADMMHPDGWTERKGDWRRDFRIITLTEDQLRIGYLRASGAWGGEWLEVFNYVSKEYADNYEAPAVEVYPTLQDDWRDYVEPKTNQIITYVLAVDDKPFDWCNPDGSLKGITSSTAASGIEGLTLQLNSRESKYTVTAPDGTKVEGTYTLSSDGIYTFSNGLPEVTLSTDGRAVFKLGADNALRIMQIGLDDYSGGLSDLWLGAMEQDALGHRYQYMGYHFVPQTSGAVERFMATLNFFNAANWDLAYASQLYIEGEGTYTFNVTESCLYSLDPAQYGVYMDVSRILATYPNVGLTVTDIKVDGTSVAFNDSDFTQEYPDGNASTNTARRYFLNPWNTDLYGTLVNTFVYNTSLSVTIQVTYDTGTPFISE